MKTQNPTLRAGITNRAGMILRNIKSAPLFYLPLKNNKNLLGQDKLLPGEKESKSGEATQNFAEEKQTQHKQIYHSPAHSTGLFNFQNNKRVKRYVLIIGPSLRGRQKNGQFYRSRKGGSDYLAFGKIIFQRQAKDPQNF